MKVKNTLAYPAIQSVSWYTTASQILLGSLYIALLSQIEIPLKPIPVTLQTFAIFSLALFQGSKKSCLSLFLYLIAATLGLPVFPIGYIDPFWIFQPSAGYCLSFPLAAYIVGKFVDFRKFSSVSWLFLGLCCGQFTIYLIGVSWLSFIIGWQNALGVGLYPFLAFDFLKILVALSMKMTSLHLIGLYQTISRKKEENL